MNLQEICKILENRIITLNEARKTAANMGDLQKVNEIDADLTTTLNSIEQIKNAMTVV